MRSRPCSQSCPVCSVSSCLICSPPTASATFATRRGLDGKTRELLSVVVLAAIGAGTQLKAHISGAVKAGNSLLELTAALVQALPYMGFPNALTALAVIANYDESESHEAYR